MMRASFSKSCLAIIFLSDKFFLRHGCRHLEIFEAFYELVMMQKASNFGDDVENFFTTK